MSNLTNNRVNVTLNETEVSQIKKSLSNVRGKLPFLVGLTPKERMKIPKINVSNKVFVEDVLNAAIANENMLSAYIDIEGLKNDLVLFSQLDELNLILSQLQEAVNDTRMLAGNEAYVVSLACYRHFETAAASGISGADSVFDSLRERFANMAKDLAKITRNQACNP